MFTLFYHKRRLHPFLFNCRRAAARYYSTPTEAYPFDNLRAFKFALSPQDAILQLAPHASAACMFKNIWGSLGARFLSGLGFEPFTPDRITPVYFPAWIIDAELQAKVTLSQREDGEERRQIAAIHFVDSYLPGCDFKALSNVSFWTQRARQTETFPFTKDLQRQYSIDVVCLPYNVSPFTLLRAARSLSYAGAAIDEDFRFNPFTLKANMIAAYPILIPLYLAQYSFTPSGNVKYNITAAIEAYTPNGRIFTERFGAEAGALLRSQLPNAPQALVDFTHALDGIGMHQSRGSAAPACNIPALMITDPPRLLAPTIESWLEDALGSPECVKQLSELSLEEEEQAALVGKDLRVREYTTEETMITRNWLASGTGLWTVKSIITAMSSTHDSSRIHIIGPTPFKTPSGQETNTEVVIGETMEALKKNKEGLERKREESKPQWWREWEEKYGERD